MPRTVNLEYGPVAGRATHIGSAEHSTGLAQEQALEWVAAVRATGKAVQHRLSPPGVDLEYGAISARSTTPGGPIDVASLVPNQRCVRVFPVRSGEAVQHGLRARGVQLVHHAAAIPRAAAVQIAAAAGSPIKATGCVLNYTREGRAPVRAEAKVVKRGERLRLCESRQPKHDQESHVESPLCLRARTGL